MNHLAYTQQAVVSPIDEQALAQAELESHLESQAQAVAPAKDPLTQRDRRSHRDRSICATAIPFPQHLPIVL
ncbi:hypothetical protein JYQ62_18450 [Nostoc sp. UHCC 0702]|nr:hypothetical protein JYQ62_18450 [Nostoc sp. UHCC 0702]